MKNKPIKIIDLFAGPGGLGEGFSSLKIKKRYPFKIALSIETEESAWKTLRLRSFVRQFIHKDEVLPKEYYQYLAGNISEEEMFEEHKKEKKAADKEALQLKLGKKGDNKIIFKKIREKLKDDNNWVLIGGPPCQAFSLVGRARNKGKKDYIPEQDHRHYLYQEYLEIIEKFSPSVFVMENVKGILSSKINGELIFDKIIVDLQEPSKALGKKKKNTYKIHSLVVPSTSLEGIETKLDPHDFIIQSEHYGIPQARHRVILLGVRSDISSTPKQLKKISSVNLEQVIGDLPKIRSGLSKKKERDSSEGWAKVISNEIGKFKSRKKADRQLIQGIKISLEKIDANKLEKGTTQTQVTTTLYKSMPEKLTKWYANNWEKTYVCNHEARGHMDSDLARYLFCSVYALVNQDSEGKIRKTPKLPDFPAILLPNHKNATSGKFVDRFKVQEKRLPATTITCHISKDGHYYIHYDSAQCRSLTVREAARIQTFPDNYFFEGNRTQQYVQVGNAVPPLLANQVAKIVNELLIAY